MENVKAILLLLVIALLGAVFLLFIRQSALKTENEDAYVLAVNTRDLLRTMDARCSAAPEQYAQLAECITPLLAMDDFREDALRQPNDREGTPGYLVIENTNQRVFNSEDFTFYKNRELVQTGCSVPGEIGYEVTCRFDYPGECEEGDILEVYYPIDGADIRVFLRTC